MTEENNEVTVSEKDMEQIDNEINKMEQEQVEAAKQEGAKEAIAPVQDSLETLKAELEQIRKQNEEAAKKAEEARLRAELEAEKKKAAETQRAAMVPESHNPSQPEQNTQAPPQPKSRQEEWSEFENAARSGGFSATVDLE